MSLLQARLRWQQIIRSERTPEVKIAVLASFTANPFAPYAGVALDEAAIPASIWIGPYNQIVQECLFDESETATFAPDVLVVWSRLEELWGGRPLPLTGESSNYLEGALEVADAALKAAKRWKASLLFVLPAIPELRPLGVGDAGNINGVFATATLVREALRRHLAGQRGVLLLDMEEVIRSVGSTKAYNPRLLATARIPFSEEAFSLAGERSARLIVLSRRAARKVVVVDADNTLWGGVVGEEGVDGLDLADNGPGEAYRGFQAFLLEVRRSGALIALNSKNNEADLWAAFKRREMVLQKEHFAAWRVNWQPKSRNLREIAQDLNLNVASFVFIDDSPMELAEVEAALPSVACIRMPADPAEWMATVQGTGELDRLPPTTEDLQRATQYQGEQQREELRKTASSEEYLTSLAVKVRIFAPTSADMARLAQLVAKTNQFNLNGKRRTESELVAISADPAYTVRLVQANDRFGDYGIIGAFILAHEQGRSTLDTFLLSCRAVSRGVEEAMIADIFAACPPDTAVWATVEDRPQNEPAKRFFARLGCETWGYPYPLQRLAWPVYVAQV